MRLLTVGLTTLKNEIELQLILLQQNMTHWEFM